MSEELRKLVRDLAGEDMPVEVIARALVEKAREGGGIPMDQLWVDSYSTEEVLKYADWEEEDVDVVLWEEEGVNDEADWAALCRLKDGRWGFVHAGCDYTGWG